MQVVGDGHSGVHGRVVARGGGGAGAAAVRALRRRAARRGSLALPSARY